MKVWHILLIGCSVIAVPLALAGPSIIKRYELQPCPVYKQFTPLPDITLSELAYICSHACGGGPICFKEKQFADLPANIKRHFSNWTWESKS